MFRSTVPVALSLLCCAACNQAPVDGGWEGTAECTETEDLTVEAILDQRLETDEVQGTFFIDYNIVFDFLGQTQTWRFTQRGEVDDAEWDPADLTIEGEVVADDNGDGEPAPDWVFNLEFTDDELTTLEGSFDAVNDNNDVVNECDLELDKFHDPSN